LRISLLLDQACHQVCPNLQRLFGIENRCPYVKDAFHSFLIECDRSARSERCGPQCFHPGWASLWPSMLSMSLALGIMNQRSSVIWSLLGLAMQINTEPGATEAVGSTS